jgi:hypothetical protein
MPNWTSNTVTVNGKKNDVLALKNFMKSKDSAFDFENLVPMPKSLWMVSGSITNIAIKAAQTGKVDLKSISFPFDVSMDRNNTEFLKDEKDLIAYGKRYLDNIAKYGHADWYDWANENWGTKWNPGSVTLNEESDTSIEYAFDTAWSAPDPIFTALAKKFPNVEIIVKSSYEDPEPWTLCCSKFENGELAEEWTETDEKMYEDYHCDDEDEDEDYDDDEEE